MNPTKLILGVEAASTLGGTLSDVAKSEEINVIASIKTQNLLLAMVKVPFLSASQIYPCTTTLPDMEGVWNLQWNGNIPAWFALIVIVAL
jgi:hypothetical protein